MERFNSKEFEINFEGKILEEVLSKYGLKIDIDESWFDDNGCQYLVLDGDYEEMLNISYGIDYNKAKTLFEKYCDEPLKSSSCFLTDNDLSEKEEEVQDDILYWIEEYGRNKINLALKEANGKAFSGKENWYLVDGFICCKEWAIWSKRS